MSANTMSMEVREDRISSPLIIFQPFNVLVWFSFFSPIIVASSITGLSFIFQNFKGLIYLGFLIGFCLLRNVLYMLSGMDPIIDDNTICTSVQYSRYGNASFSAFVFAFTIAYLYLPMMKNGEVNFWVLSILIAYFCIDLLFKLNKNCIPSLTDLGINVVAGVVCSSLVVVLMYLGGSDKFLFFNEVSKNKDICYQPSKQTFKCSMYKNGEIISEL